MPRRTSVLLFVLIALLSLTLACGSDDPAGPGTTDTTAPAVVSMDPSSGETDVDTEAAITVIFSEAMDPSSHTGQVSMTGGTLGSLSWTDNRTLSIGHAEFAEGVQVSVTLATGLADAAGNTLDAPVTFSFWTESTVFSVLWTDPEHGATDVLVNQSITVQFSQRPNMGTLASHVSLVDLAAKASWPLTVTQTGETQVRLDPDDDLTPSTGYMLTLDAGTQSDSGGTLGAVVNVGFTTGTESDDTPPQLVSLEPASGSTLSANQGFVRMTFNEPVDQDNFQPSELTAQFQLAMRDAMPVWSEGGTVLTVPLHTPLPAGVTYAVVFDEFSDVNGNVNTAGFTWTGTVAGTADHFPVLNDLVFYYEGFYVENPMGRGEKILDDFAYIYDWESGSDELFRRSEIFDEVTPPTSWEYLRKTASGILFRGFHENPERGKMAGDVWFSPEVEYVRRPMTTQQWSGSTQATPEGGSAMNLTYEVEVLAGTQDIPIGWDKLGRSWGNGKAIGDVYWNECRTAILTHEILDGVTPVETGVDTLVFAPGLGLVQTWSSFEDHQDDFVEWSRSTLTDLGLRETFKR